jgi:PHD/YefM family antitoxin component YafN of YafNO toxin-antitoxin module
VFITDRGRPAHVLLRIEDYRRLRGEKKVSLLEALSQSAKSRDFEFEPSKLGKVTKSADLN